MFQFTSLLGAQSESQARQSLLTLGDGLKILVDVGWDESFDVEQLKEIARYTPKLSLVLLTHPTISHIGAYAHCCKHIPHFASLPVFSTFPISTLGRLLLQDLYLSNPKATPRLPAPPPQKAEEDTSDEAKPPLPEYSADWLYPPPTPSEINSYFTSINLLKFSQPHHPLPVHHPNLTITAYSAGHTLGGTIWKIQSNQENIVYAVDWNHSRENHLSGAAFLPPGSSGGVSVETLGRPTALICSGRTTDEDLALGGRFSGSAGGGRKKRDDALLGIIHRVAVQEGNVVLIPTDSTARVLELAYLLEHAFRKDQSLHGGNDGGERRDNNGKKVGLYLLGKKAKRLAGVVGSMLEWMDEGVVKELENLTGAMGGGGGNQRNNQDGNQGGRRMQRNRKNQQQQSQQSQSQQNQQQKQVGPFDFLHLKVLDKRAQLERILPSTEDEIQQQETKEEDDSDSDMLDYDPETGSLTERPKKPKAQAPITSNSKRGAKQRAPIHRGMVILASDTSLEWGFAKDLFVKVAGGEGNMVLLTEILDKKGSLAQELGAAWRDEMTKKDPSKGDMIGVGLNWEKQIQISTRTPLDPSEADLYAKYIAVLQSSTTSADILLPTTTKKSKASALDLLTAVGNSDDENDDESSESESDSDSEKQGKSLATTTSKSKKALAAAAIKAAAAAASENLDGAGGEKDTKIPFLPTSAQELGISVLLRARGIYDFDVRNAKGRNRMLPVVLRRKRGDEYGETVKAEDYLRAEEKDGSSSSIHHSSSTVGSGEKEKRAIERVMGKKRKWEEAGMMSGSGGGAGGSTTKGKSSGGGKNNSRRNKRRKGDRSNRRNRKGGEAIEDGEVKEDDNMSDGSSRTYSGSNSDADSGSDSETNSEADDADSTTPTKLTIKSQFTLKICCRVHYIDYAGLHDGRSLRMLLPLINPRKLILVGGRKDQIEKLAKDCRELLNPKLDSGVASLSKSVRGTDVFTPLDGVTVNASVDTNAWTLKLSERLVRGLKWQEVGGLGVVHIIGRVVPASPEIATLALEESSKKRKMLTGAGSPSGGAGKDSGTDNEGDTPMGSNNNPTEATEEGSTPLRMLDILQTTTSSPNMQTNLPNLPTTTSTISALTTSTTPLRALKARPIHVGDIKLTDLRRVLIAAGHTAEFGGEGGMLVCDGVVVVKKIGVGRVVVEDGGGGLYVGGGRPQQGQNMSGLGALTRAAPVGGGKRSFYEVRRKVYEMLAVVAGGGMM